MMRVPECQLLAAVCRAECVVDVQDLHPVRLHGLAELIEESHSEPRRFGPARRILQTGDGRLRGQRLAALRTGLKTVIIPSENEKDLAEIPDNVKKGLEIRPVASVEEVLKIGHVRPLTPIVWEEPEERPAPALDDGTGGEDAVVTH